MSPTGNDADDGSKGRPFRTPQKAIRAAADGDEVRLAKAHYGGSLRSDKRLRFLAWNGTSTLGTGIPSVDAGPDQTRPIAPQDVGRDLSQVGVVGIPPEISVRPDTDSNSGSNSNPPQAGGDESGAACGNVRLRGSVTDPDKKAEVRWSVVEGPGDLRFVDASARETLAAFNGVGRYVLRLTARNGPYRVTSDMVLETGISENCHSVQPQPELTVKAGPARSYTNVLRATLEGWVGVVPASEPVTVKWTPVEGPSRPRFAVVSQTNTVVEVDGYGTYRIRLSAASGRRSRSEDVVIRFVQDDRMDLAVWIPPLPPVELPSGTVAIDADVTYRGSRNLPGGVNVQWNRVSGPAEVSFATPNRVDTNARFTVLGTYTIGLTARYGTKSTNMTRVVVVRDGVNRPPDVRNLRAPEFVDLPDAAPVSGEVTDDGLPSNPGKVRLEWRTISGPAPVTFLPVDRSQSSARFRQPGQYRIALWATDSRLEDSEWVDITVRGALHYVSTREDGQRRCGALGSPILVCNSHPKYRIRYTILLRRQPLWQQEFDTILTGVLAPGECREFACSDRSVGPGYGYVLHRIVAAEFVTTNSALLGVGVGVGAESTPDERLEEDATEAAKGILTLSRAGDSWLVSWPAVLDAAVLETSTSVGTGAVWQPVTQSSEIEGDRRVVRLTMEGAIRFFRLRLP